MSKPKTHITIPFLKFMYHLVRKRKVKNRICVIRGERMSNEDFEKYTAIVNEIKNGIK